MKKHLTLSELTAPIWQGGVIYGETVYPLELPSLYESGLPLLYSAEEILSVRGGSRLQAYENGADYTLENGRLMLKKGKIPTIPLSAYYPAEREEGKVFDRTGGGYILFSETPLLHSSQLSVTYRTGEAWAGPVPPRRGGSLPRTSRAQRDGGSLAVLFYGDSITTGANSSGTMRTPPYTDDWCRLTVRAMEKLSGNGGISMVNTAVGGTDAKWGAENAEERAASKLPDLAVIAFGMNDASEKVPPEEYGENIKKIISAVRARKPECEFVLVATTLANEEVNGFAGRQREYLPVLSKIAAEAEGIAVADMTSMHEYLLSKKRFYDMTGNNVNHPNDFIARVYAQVVLETIKV